MRAIVFAALTGVLPACQSNAVRFSGTLLVFLLVVPSLHAQNSADFYDRAETALRAGKIAEAETLYARIQPGQPEYVRAQLRLGTIYYSTGRPALAEKALEKYLALEKTAEGFTLLAGAQFNLEKSDIAYKSAKQALRLDPKYAKAYTALGMIYTARKDWPDADAAYQEALKLDAKDSGTWFLLGRSYFFRNEFEKARDAYERSLRLNPESIRAYENLGLTLDLLNQPEAAEKAFQTGIEHNRRSPLPEARIHIAYGNFLSKLDRLEDSRRQLEEAARIAPHNAETHFELTKLFVRMKRWKEAAQEGEAALRVGGPDYRVHFLLSTAYTALADFPRASRHAKESERLAEKR